MIMGLEIDREFIKTWLPRGEIGRLADKMEVPRNSAYRILSGEWNNPEFVTAAYELALERANKWLAVRQKVNDIKKNFESND
jgi:hypothetical protein